MAQARMDWNKIIGARSLILSGFYSDPALHSVILDRCLIAILLDQENWCDAEAQLSDELIIGAGS